MASGRSDTASEPMGPSLLLHQERLGATEEHREGAASWLTREGTPPIPSK